MIQILDTNLCLLHPSKQLIDEPQAAFVLWWRHGHKLRASHWLPQERGPDSSHSTHSSEQGLPQWQAAVSGSLAGLFCHGAPQGLGEVAFPVDAGALQSEGDQLLLKAGHSDDETKI